MAKKVMSSITDEVKTAKYFSVSVDSTPDISHMDQLSFTIRYVLPTTGPVERFLQFIPMLSHTGIDIATTVLDFLKEKNISVLECRGQSYDNASNMSGKYQGTQQIIKNECSEAEYIPCMADSLNLVDTRWSARADAVAALSRAHKENIIVLEEFSSDLNQPAETRAEASGLLKGLKKLETVILLEVWDTVLEIFQSASIQLQKPGISLNTAVTLLESLLQFVKDLRSQFDDFEEKAMAKCDPSDVTGKVAYYADRQSQRIKKRKRHHDELDSVEDVTLTERDMFRVTAFMPIIDKLYAALTQRLAAYSDLREKFGFLSEISNKTNTELKAAAEKLVSSYPNDLEAGLESDLLQFAHLMKSIPRGSSESAPSLGGVKAAQRQSPELEMYKVIPRHDMVETFANVEIVLRLYLCIFVTNCTGERSFSKLKLLKNYLRNTMGQNRLSSLTLLSIEHEKLRVLDFTDVIKQFAILNI
ncbi:zinc finger MYM-type protein 1-like [Palaemon carinicauda]|uniref:zinc finger MYM-type protein 1-like n=1 Tax=Palaemon carinicauda TaxID=392227 RepID=UPI0035B58447